jgi:hypothetical protein
MGKIIRLIAISAIVLILTIPWIFIFIHDYIAFAIAFDAVILMLSNRIQELLGSSPRTYSSTIIG